MVDQANPESPEPRLPSPPAPGWSRRAVHLGVLVGAQLVALAFVTLGHVFAYTSPDYGFDIDEEGYVRGIDRDRRDTAPLKPGDRLVAAGPAGHTPPRSQVGSTGW